MHTYVFHLINYQSGILINNVTDNRANFVLL